jgi:hypothetical protein
MLHVYFTRGKSRVKNIRRFKQWSSRCKMAGAELQSFAGSRALICNLVMADCGVLSAVRHNKHCHTADGQRLNLRVDSHKSHISY